jgi:hypothetical protein
MDFRFNKQMNGRNESENAELDFREVVRGDLIRELDTNSACFLFGFPLLWD